jgi:hypothetical protein
MTENNPFAFIGRLHQKHPIELVHNAVGQASLALQGEESDTSDLITLMGTPLGRDGLLMYVMADGDEAVINEALGHTPPAGLVDAVLDATIGGGGRPANDLADAALHYLENFVLYDRKVVDASDVVKGNLYAVGAVLAYWKKDKVTALRGINGALAFDSESRLAHLVASWLWLDLPANPA